MHDIFFIFLHRRKSLICAYSNKPTKDFNLEIDIHSVSRIFLVIKQGQGRGLPQGTHFLGDIIGQNENHMIIMYGSFKIYLMLS